MILSGLTAAKVLQWLKNNVIPIVILLVMLAAFVGGSVMFINWKKNSYINEGKRIGKAETTRVYEEAAKKAKAEHLASITKIEHDAQTLLEEKTNELAIQRQKIETLAANNRKLTSSLQNSFSTRRQQATTRARGTCAPAYREAATGWHISEEAANLSAEMAETAERHRQTIEEWQAYYAAVEKYNEGVDQHNAKIEKKEKALK